MRSRILGVYNRRYKKDRAKFSKVKDDMLAEFDIFQKGGAATLDHKRVKKWIKKGVIEFKRFCALGFAADDADPEQIQGVLVSVAQPLGLSLDGGNGTSESPN